MEMKFNEEHYLRVRKHRDGNRDEKYCPVLGKYLGERGFLRSHENDKDKGSPMYQDKNGGLFELLETYVHWNKGYYYHGIFRDKDTGHKEARYYQNINSIDPVVIEGTNEMTFIGFIQD